MPDALLEAAALGPDVPTGQFPVVIHSVFRSAVNLQGGPGDKLITLLAQPWDQPQAIRLAGAVDFTAQGLEPRAQGRFHATGLELDRPGRPPLAISFAHASRIRPTALPFIPELGRTWQAGVEYLGQWQAEAGTDFRIRTLTGHEATPGCLGARLNRGALALGDTVRSGALPSIRAASQGLVGLGSGLTPSGDDFLCGFLAAGHCRVKAHSAGAGLLRELKRSILEGLAATHAISATFLRCAIEGKAGSALLELARTLPRHPASGPCATSAPSGTAPAWTWPLVFYMD